LLIHGKRGHIRGGRLALAIVSGEEAVNNRIPGGGI
jgi:hypothetical protein